MIDMQHRSFAVPPMIINNSTVENISPNYSIKRWMTNFLI